MTWSDVDAATRALILEAALDELRERLVTAECSVLRGYTDRTAQLRRAIEIAGALE